MNLTSGIIEIDLHGLRVEEAVKKVKAEVGKAPGSNPGITELVLR